MRCCTVLNLVLDNQQCEHRKPFWADDIKWQQYENAEEVEMQRSENIIWQTAKESKSYICQHAKYKLPGDTHRQQAEDGTKTQHHSALLLFTSQNIISEQLCKFQKNIKAWFTSDGCTPHYRWLSSYKEMPFNPQQQVFTFKIKRDKEINLNSNLFSSTPSLLCIEGIMMKSFFYSKIERCWRVKIWTKQDGFVGRTENSSFLARLDHISLE